MNVNKDIFILTKLGDISFIFICEILFNLVVSDLRYTFDLQFKWSLLRCQPKQQCLLFILAIQQSGNEFPYSHDSSQQFQKRWKIYRETIENLSQPYHKSTRVNSIMTNKSREIVR